jgi:TRAP-type transport system periplasmic protein
MSVRTSFILRATVGLALMLSGCAAVDRAGNEPAAETVTLTAVNPLGGDEFQPYLRAVEKLSGGTVRIDVEEEWHVGDLDNEKDAVEQARQGTVDLAFVPVRAWSGLDVHSFDALIAPLVVDSHALEREVLASELPSQMLDGVAPLGLTGLGILPGPMRKPVGVSRALLVPADYQDAGIGISDSAIAVKFLGALGATATPSSFFGQPIASYDGIEQQVTSVEGNGYDEVATSIAANVNLWPRPISVVANTDAIEPLTDEQRDALQEAARESLDDSIRQLEGSEQEAVSILCRRGRVRFDRADETTLGQLHAAAEPVISELSQDAETAAVLADIAALRTKASLVADNETVPTCEGVAPEQGAQAAGEKGPLDGTWTMSETFQDLVAKGGPPDESHVVENFGDWVFVVDRGRFAYTQQNGPACTWGYGTWQTDGNRVQWRFVDGGGIAPNDANTRPGEVHDFTWSLYRDTLTLGPVEGAISPANYYGQPWRRVSGTPQADQLFTRCGLPEQGIPK